MPKNPIVFTLDGRRCTCLLPEGKPKRLYVLCGWEMEKLMMPPTLDREMPIS